MTVNDLFTRIIALALFLAYGIFDGFVAWVSANAILQLITGFAPGNQFLWVAATIIAIVLGSWVFIGLMAGLVHYLPNYDKTKALKVRNESGQGLVEYALILVLVAVIVIVILALVGPAISQLFHLRPY